ncbi:MAG: hypothetical protein SF187_08345 [Deltaproteobacteria bacterium]|nr:hypothetical protein [Deltaproteobacteria bacterium]
MSTRAVTRSYLAAFTLFSAASIFACGGGGGGGSGGTGGGKSCDDGFVLDDNGDCVEDTGGGGTAGEAGTGGSSANGGSGEGGSAATGGSGGGAATGGKGGTAAGGSPGTGGMAMTGGMPGTGGTPVVDAAICPKEGNCKLLAVGDGLAAGTGASPGYLKLVLDFLATKNKKGVEWVGSKTAGAYKHEGTNDVETAALLTTIEATIKATMPNIVVLNVGSEDAFNSKQAGIAGRMKQIFDKIRAARPGTYVLITGLSRTGDSNGNPSAFTTRAHAADQELDAAVTTWNDPRVRFVKFNFLPQFAQAPAGKPAPVSGSYFTGNKYYPNASGYKNMSNLAIGIALSQVVDH